MQPMNYTNQQKSKTEKPTPKNSPQPYKNPQKNTPEPMQL